MDGDEKNHTWSRLSVVDDDVSVQLHERGAAQHPRRR
jgi:hypothetical protein